MNKAERDPTDLHGKHAQKIFPPMIFAERKAESILCFLSNNRHLKSFDCFSNGPQSALGPHPAAGARA